MRCWGGWFDRPNVLSIFESFSGMSRGAPATDSSLLTLQQACMISKVPLAMV